MAIFNYENIEWAASTEYGGNSMTGQSTTHAAKVTYLILIHELIISFVGILTKKNFLNR